MNTRNLAALIESYLEADDTTDASGSSSNGATAVTDTATRQKLGQLMQLTAQLKQDSDKMKQDIAGLKNNVQMSGLLPLLLNQKLTLQSATKADGTPLTLPAQVDTNETFTFKQGDVLSALLPVILMGGFGSDSGTGTDNSTTMLLMALAISGKF